MDTNNYVLLRQGQLKPGKNRPFRGLFLLRLKEFMSAYSSQARNGDCDMLTSSFILALLSSLLHGSHRGQDGEVTNPASWCLKRQKERPSLQLFPRFRSNINILLFCVLGLSLTALGRWVCDLDRLLTNHQ